MRKKYNNLKIIPYHQAPNGEQLVDKWAIVDGTLLVSAIQGLSREDAERFLPEYEKQKRFVFAG